MSINQDDINALEHACRNLGLSNPRVRDAFDLDDDIHRHFFDERDLNRIAAHLALEQIKQHTFVYVDKPRKAVTEKLI